MIKTIEFWGRLYDVSDDGRVFCDGRELRQNYNHDGYRVVSVVNIEGEPRTVGVHRFVAMAFVRNDDPENQVEVNHKNYVRDDNRAENLEWMTHADNVRYSNVHRPDVSGVKNPNYGNKKLSQIYALDKELAKEKQGRPGLQNGRCRAIDMYRGDELVATFPYMSLCFQYLVDNGITVARTEQNIRSQIDRAVRNNCEYKGFRFVKH